MSPWRPLPPCSMPLCPNRQPCPVHGQQRWENRPNSRARGYGHVWRKLRERILARDPVCVLCWRAPSTQCDHIVPKSKGGTDSDANLRGICRRCHDSKSGLEGQAAR